MSGLTWKPTVKRVSDVTWRMWRIEADIKADLTYIRDHRDEVPNPLPKILAIVAQSRRN
jgi:hypothetical protein